MGERWREGEKNSKAGEGWRDRDGWEKSEAGEEERESGKMEGEGR